MGIECETLNLILNLINSRSICPLKRIFWKASISNYFTCSPHQKNPLSKFKCTTIFNDTLLQVFKVNHCRNIILKLVWQLNLNKSRELIETDNENLRQAEIGIEQKVQEWPSCPFATMIYSKGIDSFWQKDSLVNLILFDLCLFKHFSL